MKLNKRMSAFSKSEARHLYVVASLLVLFLYFPCLLQAQQSALDSISKKIDLLKKENPDDYKDSIYVKLRYNYASRHRFIQSDSLFSISKELLKISKSITYPKGEVLALLGIGDYYSDKGDSEKSLSNYLKSFERANEIGDTEIKLRLFINIGQEHSFLGKYEEALQNYLEGIDLASINEEKYLTHLSIFNELIANLYESQKEYEQALTFYLEAKKFNDKMGNEKSQAETLTSLSNLLSKMGRFDRAMFDINNSIAVFEKLKIYDWLAYAYTIKGHIYLDQKNYKWSLHWFDQSKALHRNLDDDRTKIDLFDGMANAYLGMSRDSLSLIYAQQSFDISKRIKSLEGQKDGAKTLYKIYKKQGDHRIALEYHELFQSISDTLSRDGNKRSLSLLKTKLDYNQQKKDLIFKNNKELAKQQNYIITTLVVIFALLVTGIPLYFNQKKQKKLYKVLKESTQNLGEREEELREINKTKDKLFSIIGHDLRGPIGALQGLLNLFSKGDVGMEEFQGFVPKLKSDVDHILFTLNNLLSWGYAQMNGSNTRPKSVSISKIVDNSINLLSELAASKDVTIVNKIKEKPLAYADENHLDVVIRNLISNAIKFTPQNGLVTIEAEEDKQFWRIKVQDTGIGMDRKTQQKLFSDNSNYTTYGTNNEKGTGLGLSLCKDMVERNNGKIWVESTLRHGSNFYFTIPKALKTYKNAG